MGPMQQILIGVFGLNSSEIWTPAVLLVEAGGPVLYTSTTLPDIVQESTLTVLVQEHPWKSSRAPAGH